MPKVSFILPAYKERFLKESIESVLTQTYRDFELIVVDDCSPENLKQIVDQFDDSRISYYCNERNLGGKDLIAAWEHAMFYAKGEWCVLASDDDVYAPEYLEEMFRLTEKYPQVDVVHARSAIIDGSGRWIKDGELRKEWESAIELTYSRGICRNLQAMPDFMFRKAAFEEIGGFVNFPIAWYSDDATWMMLAKNGGIACSSRVLFFCRMSELNISATPSHIPEKLEAGYRFSRWARSFIRDIQPINVGEGRMKMAVLRGVEKACLFDARLHCYGLTVFKVLKILSTCTIPVRWKISIFVRRIARIELIYNCITYLRSFS